MNRTVYICPVETFSSYLKSALTSFVEYKVNASGCVPESFVPVLTRFDHHCMEHPETEICLKQDAIHSFLKQKTVKKSTLQRIESIIRSFGKYMILVLHVDDTYVLPHLIHHRGKTFVPYVFTSNEILLLFKAADNYKLKIHNKPTTNLVNCIRCLIKMLYCTGMRVSEACYLKVSDVDLENGILTITKAKLNTSRLVPMSESLNDYCKIYVQKMDLEMNSTGYYYPSRDQGKYHRTPIYVKLKQFMKEANIFSDGSVGPRVHDIRHTFSVHSLEKMVADGMDIGRRRAEIRGSDARP